MVACIKFDTENQKCLFQP